MDEIYSCWMERLSYISSDCLEAMTDPEIFKELAALDLPNNFSESGYRVLARLFNVLSLAYNESEVQQSGAVSPEQSPQVLHRTGSPVLQVEQEFSRRISEGTIRHNSFEEQLEVEERFLQKERLEAEARECLRLKEAKRLAALKCEEEMRQKRPLMDLLATERDAMKSDRPGGRLQPKSSEVLLFRKV